ncbi:phosphotransferase [Gordonia sp. SID5947]|uniref:DUF7064 domain-containing protein n=1 Tax=Gordonia sp. SID5947 TaxID=2690315 RepID=UPI00136F672D|nr:phosphotransferase [Gordonia sp. SID5947]MYR05516.1 phosphotransferase [Gordonia sp. SID5947]
MSQTDHQVCATDDVTAEWLSAKLGAGPITHFSIDRIGTGQMSDSHRVTLTYGSGDGPRSVILKVASSDEGSRSTGASLGLYEREVRFYQDVAPLVDDPSIAHCYHASIEPDGRFCLLLADAGNSSGADDIAGATLSDAINAVTALARIHRPCLGHSAVESADWLQRDSPIDQGLFEGLYNAFVQRYGEQLDPAHRDLADRFVAGFDGYVAHQAGLDVQGLVHGDFRLDNMLFDERSGSVTVVDWQTVTWGPAAMDLAYFLGLSVPTDVRRAEGEQLVRAYHDALEGAWPGDIASLWEAVRSQSFFGVLMSIVSSMLVQQTERGDTMFMTMFARACTLALDLDAVAVLPEPVEAEPLQPRADDEDRHEPGPEDLWNESWYFDFADVEQGIGGYIRLGLTPNAGTAWYTAMICGPSIPTIAVVDYELPVPPGSRIESRRFVADQEIVNPLHEARIRLDGTGIAVEDPADLLSGSPSGADVAVSMNLTWTTDGTGYQYRVTPRYEIPCRVVGTVRVEGVGAEPIELSIDTAGQRDHSWGVRDWWSMDWVWTTGHFSDGSHLHGLDLRIPDMPAMSIGYIQSPDMPITELQVHRSDESFADNGLPEHTSLHIDPPDRRIEFEPLGHGPLRLTSPDGAVSLFPRAWGRLRTDSGTEGVGWIEWNRHRANG